MLSENNEPFMALPQPKSKITSAVWGPLDEMIITGHENGELVQWDVKVMIANFLTMIHFLSNFVNVL